jgi:hypothetical protein
MQPDISVWDRGLSANQRRYRQTKAGRENRGLAKLTGSFSLAQARSSDRLNSRLKEIAARLAKRVQDA